MRFTTVRALVALASLAMVGAGACGSSAPQPEGTTASAEPDPSEGPPLPPGADVAPGQGVGGLPPLVSDEAREAPPRLEDEPPTIGDLSAAEQAAAAGHHAAAEAYFATQQGGRSTGRALIGLGRVQLSTGRYDEAIETAGRAAVQEDVRVAAQTLLGEALMARGRLDEAEAALQMAATHATGHRANVLLGRLYSQRGRAVDAAPHFMRLIEAYNDERIGSQDGEGLAYVAMAAWGLGSFRDANDAFQEATRADGQREETQLEWARMFLEKYDAGHAEEGVRQVFARNPESAVGHALMARIKLEQSFDFASATAYVERALEINPSLVMAHVSLAGMDLRDMNLPAADAHLDRALEVNPHDLEALSVRAAVRFLADDAPGFATAKRAVFQRNRNFSRMYSIIGEYAEWEHRYPEIVRMAREAVTLNPGDAYAHATLGLNLLRMGEESDGLEALRESWRRDRYNVHVFNTLNLYDDVLPNEYTEVSHGPFIFRMHREERPILERYVPRVLQGAYTDMRRRYGMTPDGPVRIELFANTQHFSVRTTGLPNLGVQGVCFGKVVTALSPRGGQFNWGQITWHELAHVFHIQMSRNRVPRWFTEGLAEYETIVARPEWRREEDHQLWAALVGDRLPPLRLMNRAFTHARSAQDMMTAYYASSQIVVYIAERFGFERLVQMLREWGSGRSSEEVIQRSLGVGIDQLDRDFRQHTRRRLAGREADFRVDLSSYADLPALRSAADAAPADADAQAALAAGLLVAGEAEDAHRAAERAIGMEPAQPVARFILARMALVARDAEKARQHLHALLSGGRDGYEIRLLSTRAALAAEDQAGARRELEAATRIDGDRAEAWQGLLAVSQQTGDRDLRFRALEQLARIDQHGRETWGHLLAELARRERWPDVVRVGEGALLLDPHNGEVHRLLAEGYLQTEHPQQALAELDAGLLTAPDSPGPIHLARARALLALGNRSGAREAADAAVAADAALGEQARRILGGGSAQ